MSTCKIIEELKKQLRAVTISPWPSMPEVIEILQSGNEKAVSFIVSHDHVDLLQAANFTTLSVDARRINNANMGLDNLSTDEAVPAFVQMLRGGTAAKSAATESLAVDTMFIKLFFAEADYWAQPLGHTASIQLQTD